MVLQPCVTCFCCPRAPPGSGRASADLLLTSFPLSSKARKNNLLPVMGVQTLLLQVRKPLPSPGAFRGSLWSWRSPRWPCAPCRGDRQCHAAFCAPLGQAGPCCSNRGRAGHRRLQLQHPRVLAGQQPRR